MNFIHAAANQFTEHLTQELKTRLTRTLSYLKKSALVFISGTLFLLFGLVFLMTSLFFAFAELTRLAQAGLWSGLVTLGTGGFILLIGQKMVGHQYIGKNDRTNEQGKVLWHREHADRTDGKEQTRKREKSEP